jgi:hypothetical protein
LKFAKKKKVKAAKLEAQAIILKPMNESSNVALAKMEEEAKILTVDLSTMDPLAKAWYMMYHECINKEVITTQEAPSSMPTPIPSLM